MRTILLLTILLSAATSKAQTVIPSVFGGYSPYTRFSNNLSFTGDSLSKKKWSLSRFSAISTSFTFFNGGNAAFFSAPVGLQLNRRLNDNLYAFANVSVAPTYINFNRSFSNNNFNKTAMGNAFYGQNSLGVYSAASMGIMYINNDKTFSISGSISVEKSNNPLLPVYSTNTSVPVRSTPLNR